MRHDDRFLRPVAEVDGALSTVYRSKPGDSGAGDGWPTRPIFAVGLAAGAAALLFVLVAVFQTLLYHVFAAPTYLVLHTLLELASIVVSIGIFLVNWHASRQRRNTQSLFVGVAFLTVAAVDTMHTLSFPGMPEFVTLSSTHKGIVYWLTARLVESLGLLVAAYIAAGSTSWLLRRRVLLAGNLAIIASIFVVNSYYPWLVPPMFVEGEGLTPLKVALEYLVIGLNLAAIAIYWRRWAKVDSAKEPVPVHLLLAALAVVVFAELAFTLYRSAYDTYNLLGHVYKVAAYYLIFRALFVSSIERPYRDLAHSEAEQARLYRLEERKTKELLALGRLLNASLRLEEVLGAVVRAARELLGAGGAAILLHDEATATFLVGAGDGVVAGTQQRLLAAKTLAIKVVAAGEVRWIDDLRDAPDIVAPLSTAASFRSLLAAPLKSGGRTIGALEAFSTHPAAFGPEQAALLVAFADAAGIAMRNAQAHGEIQRLLGEVQAREERLAAQNEELTAQAEQLRLQNNRIQTQNEEIHVQNEELADRQRELERQNIAVEQLYELSRQQEAQLRAIIDATADGLMLVDGSQRVVAVNPALEALTGTSAAELVGRPCRNLLAARQNDNRLLCDASCPVCTDHPERLSADAVITTRDGREVWVNVAFGLIKGDDGRPSMVVHAIRDINARKELERQKDEFLSIAAHDLKTPLTAIKGYAQLLLRRARQDERRQDELAWLAVIVERVARMTDLINSLLDLTRIEMGRLELRREHLDLWQVAQGVVSNARLSAEGHDIVLLGDEGGLAGFWDHAYVERVLTNLVDNAVKYSPDGGRVAVTVARQDGEALIIVQDEGVGITAEDQGRIFDRYFRASAAREEAKGLGLGLYITKGLVEAHGGRIWVESPPRGPNGEPGKGTSFFVTLPLSYT